MDPWMLANGFVSLIGMLILSAVVLHPQISEGLIVKFSLIIMILSLMATAALTFKGSEDWTAYWRAAVWLRGGLVLACLGVLVRYTGCGIAEPKRRLSDWINDGTERHRKDRLA